MQANEREKLMIIVVIAIGMWAYAMYDTSTVVRKSQFKGPEFKVGASVTRKKSATIKKGK